MSIPDDIKVSIIIYVKDGMPYFPEALESAARQTLKDIEILVVDGGSSDGTLEIAENFSNDDKRVRVLHSALGSVGAQLNMAISEARGEYIGIVEADDRILPDMYEKEYAFAQNMGFPDVVRADNYIFWGSGNGEVALRTSLSHDATSYGVILSAKKFPGKVLVGGSFWTGIYRREFLLNKRIRANESKGAAYQDFSFLFLASVLADSICFMKDAFYYYRKDNPRSSCNDPIGISLIDDEYLFLKNLLLERGIWETYQVYYYMWKIRNYVWFYKNVASDKKEGVLQLMHESISSDAGRTGFPFAALKKSERDVAERSLGDREEFCRYWRQKDKEWEESCHRIKELKSIDCVYLFGAGNIADIVIHCLRKKNIVPRHILDNNKKIWGSERNGIPVGSPTILESEHKEGKKVKLIVCSENYAQEIKQQVLGMGIEENRTMTCDNMDACVRMAIEQ